MNCKDEKNKLTPLLIATQKGWNALVAVLLEKGADATAAMKKGATSLHLAAARVDKQLVDMLLSAVRACLTPRLLHVYSTSVPRWFSALRPRGTRASLGSIPSRGRTPLPPAAVAPRSHLQGADLSAVAKNAGETALFAAAQNNHSDMVEHLILRGADPTQTEGAAAVYQAFQLDNRTPRRNLAVTLP